MKTYAINVLAGLILFFTPIQGLLLGVGAIIILDTFTGIFKSVKKGGWRSIKSRILSNVISKMLLYELCIILLYPIDKYLLNELLTHLISIPFFATKLTCIILIFIEGVSIKENIEEALKINIWQLLRNVIKRAKEVKQDINELKS